MTVITHTNDFRKPLMRSLYAFGFLASAILVAMSATARPPHSTEKTPRTYLGFDRNDYPGDAAMKLLRHDFAFTGYWLSPPPGEKTNTWAGRREYLRSQGFGFLLLYRARESKELRSLAQAQELGKQDARATAAAAQREDFPKDNLIFLDIEEGGRLSPLYHAYIQSWLWELSSVYYRGGFYCSGMPVNEGHGVTVTTAGDIFNNLWQRSRAFKLWVYNDACPPSPGCTFPPEPPAPSKSGIDFVTVWQFAQSPRRKQFTARCPARYARDGNCYAPSDSSHQWFLDLNSTTSPDPSTAPEWPEPK